MIGIIITGHMHFASGLKSSVELIAGEQEFFKDIDFLPNGETSVEQVDKACNVTSQSTENVLTGDGVDKLEKDLSLAIYEMSSSCNGIIIFADLVGGTPFKTAATLATKKDNVRVLCGTNLPMLCEIALSRTFVDDLDALVETAISTGKEGVMKFEMPKPVNNEPEDGEGI